VRAALAVFADTLNPTLPAPVPLAPLAIDIQLASDLAVHVQLLSVVTVTELDPPAAGMDIVVAERL
jgi:hypothetical protein